MKLKSFFLCMLGAAVFVGCNNEIDGPVGGQDGPDAVIEGLPIYASMTINAGPNQAATYAGGSEVAASTRETQVTDVAMYIYKSDPSGFIPQCAVYLANIPASNLVTMRTTSGTKKIFVAANPKTNPTSTAMVNTGTFNNVSTDMPLNFLLNDTLYSTSATAFGKGSFATPAKTKADGLIVNFAMGSIYGDGIATTTYSNTSARALMTNWDGPIDNYDSGSNPYDGNATFALKPDIDSVSSITNAHNRITINVQRQYAKISLKFASAITKTTGVSISTPQNLATDSYAAAVSENQEGRFIPWGATTNYYWSLGNIPTAQLPFQQFDANDGTSIRDVFYTLKDDSLSNAAHFNTWTRHYDNTRVFPMASVDKYPNPSTPLTVSAVKANMLLTSNRTTMTTTGATNPASADYKYAFSTENARSHAVMQDHQGYVIVGGFYQPKTVTTGIERAAIALNGIVGTTTATPFAWTPNAGDTLYYYAPDKIFIVGKTTLLAYYAWQKKLDVTAGGEPGGTILSGNLNASHFDSSVFDAINLDIADKRLFAYFEGQCWYRIFLLNDAAQPERKVIIARNHIYDVTILSIKGPGIADPNDIINPGKPVLELDTYVTAEIVPLKWHRVEQGVDVDNQ